MGSSKAARTLRAWNRALAIGVIIGLAVMLSAGGSRADDAEEVIKLHPGVWEGFERYKKARKPLAFAVSRDGRRSHGIVCPDQRCVVKNYKQLAVQRCGKDCVVFAVGVVIMVPYEVQTEQSPEETLNELLRTIYCEGKSETACQKALADWWNRRDELAAEFETGRSEINRKWDAAFAEYALQHNCNQVMSPDCQKFHDEVERKRTKEVADLEKSLTRQLIP